VERPATQREAGDDARQVVGGVRGLSFGRHVSGVA
jgi:hypothetical protein